MSQDIHGMFLVALAVRVVWLDVRMIILLLRSERIIQSLLIKKQNYLSSLSAYSQKNGHQKAGL